MIYEIKHPDSIPIFDKESVEFKFFLQLIANRRAVGGLRYGKIGKGKKYMTRLHKEFQSYKKTGNIEQLINIAVYAFLESYEPENKKFHFDNTVDSVTRGKV